MEAIKHIVHPGKEKDNEVLYGSNRTSDPVHSGDTIAGHHMDPQAGNVNKPLPHTPASTLGTTGSTTASHHHSHGTLGDTHIGEVRHHYHTEHQLHPQNPPPLEDPRIADAIQFGHTPVEALKAAIEAPVPSTILSEVPVVPAVPVAGQTSHQSNTVLGGRLPDVDLHPTGTTSTTTTTSGVSGAHHIGRDAAVLGGATTAGAAGYSAGTQYDDPSRLSGPLDSSTAGPYSGTTAPHSGTTGGYSSSTTTGGTDPHHHEGQRNTGFLDKLHRNKDGHPDDTSYQQPYSSTTGTTGVGQDTYDSGHHERHRLHKDPPQELLEQKGLSTGPNGQYVTDPNAGRY